MCTYKICEKKHRGAICDGASIQTEPNNCRIREFMEAPPHIIPWHWPEWAGGSTLRGPCFRIVGSAPCDDEYEITSWYQWVESDGSSSCDSRFCFFNCDEAGDIPECGLANAQCPND